MQIKTNIQTSIPYAIMQLRSRFQYCLYVTFNMIFVSCASLVQAETTEKIRTIVANVREELKEGADPTIGYLRSGKYCVVEVRDHSLLRQFLNPYPEQTEAARRCNATIEAAIDDEISRLGCSATLSSIIEVIERDYPGQSDCIEYAKYAIRCKQIDCSAFKKAYAITTPIVGYRPFTIVGLVTSLSWDKHYRGPLTNLEDIYTSEKLKSIRSETPSRKDNLYNSVLQALVREQTDLQNSVLLNKLEKSIKGDTLDSQPIFVLDSTDFRRIIVRLFPPPVWSGRRNGCDQNLKAVIDDMFAERGRDLRVEDFLANPVIKQHWFNGCKEYTLHRIMERQFEKSLDSGAFVITNGKTKATVVEIRMLVTTPVCSNNFAAMIGRRRHVFTAEHLISMPAPAGETFTNMYDFLRSLVEIRLTKGHRH